MAMVSFRLLSILCSLVILISQTSAQPVGYVHHFCRDAKGTYTANGTYETNLKTLLSNLTANTEIDYGFYNFSYGQSSDKVNEIGLCRGDLSTDVCRSCLNDSRVFLSQKCPNQKEAIVWCDYCMLRYSNRSIFGHREGGPVYHTSNPVTATGVNFNQVLRNLMANLSNIASSGDCRRKFAAGNASAGFETIFGLVQCTPDLSHVECADCLLQAITELPNCCHNKIGGRVVIPSCNIRYEMLRFYDPTADAPPQVSPPPPSTNNTASEGKSNTPRIVIATVVPIVAVIVLLVFICIYLRVRKSKENFEVEDDADDVVKTTESLQFQFDTIRVATTNFSDANKLGRGGFGAVYKGRLTNGQEIAVKRLSMNSGQGDIEFENEVLLLVAKLQHRNLVRLLGFCLEGRERLLIYEFVQNKSLDYFIFDPIKRLQLDWERRYHILEGIARGLLYLHEGFRLSIIHRDLKASNILLDEEMNAKISDFGMARLVVDQTQVNTNRIVGTYGYMAPEYAMQGLFSVKSDVFSFGVLVLEIMSGHKNNCVHQGENIEHLLSFTWRHWREGTVANIIDLTLNDGSRNEMLRCIHIGLLCVQENIADRPTMATVVVMLNNHSLTLPEPSKPAFFIDSRSSSNMPSWEFNSVNEASITELYPR